MACPCLQQGAGDGFVGSGLWSAASLRMGTRPHSPGAGEQPRGVAQLLGLPGGRGAAGSG